MEAPKTIHPLELKEQLDRGEDIFLMDVREAWEHSLASIPGSEHVPLNEVADRVQEYIYEENIVVYCHHGERSYRAALILIESGFPNVSNLSGGIDAWSQIADPSIPRYRPGG
ncbi:MAG: rhodanese [Candidatus Nitrohelix vancouverensis]|uniref:Rhodanese n=1 Tax=Candidatus Nitrohelix vancouverensis TaxID=2705534 RepID=A0A7T0G2J2_9BACT|nr:MAG: rhodanese [Candidatus Nitrohelix vancouverensis]